MATPVIDKTMSVAEMASHIETGMTIGIGGWGGRRKPMALIREILKTDVTDLTIAAYGGCDVGMLASAGKIKKLIFGFVSLDVIPMEAHFRRARSAGEFEVMEVDEGMFQLGLKAAAQKLPFLPCRAGLGTDVLTRNPDIKIMQDPYKGEHLVAMPAIELDLAFCHVSEADVLGNSYIGGPDMFFDEWFCRAADKAYLTAEHIVPTAAFDDAAKVQNMPIERNLVAGVAAAPLGAHPTSNGPDYGIDVGHLKTYSQAAGDGWQDYCDTYIATENYIEAVGGEDHIRALPLPVF
ncbi:MAG: CoA transferase subunit A [Parvibaculales bacterium]